MSFAVILADPPWEYRVGGIQGDVREQYGTMPLAQLAAIPVASFAAPDCVLALWATFPKLDEAFPLMTAWGFEYVTGFPWIKTVSGTIRRGVGFWTQGAAELLLIGRRGDPRRQDGGGPVLGLMEGEARQFYAPSGKHSRKPEGLPEWLERTLPGPYLELFARRERPGWTCWGGDLGFLLSASGVASVPRPRFPQPELALLEGERVIIYTEDTYRLEPPMLIHYEDPPRRPLHHAGAPGKQGRRQKRSHLARHWFAGISLSVSGATLAGGGFALATGASGWGAAGVLLAAGVVTTWLSAPRSHLSVTVAAWVALLAGFIALGQVDPLAGLVVWALLCGALVVGVWRACRWD